MTDTSATTALCEAVPNVSTADEGAVAILGRALSRADGVRLIHRTADPAHGRSVFTALGQPEAMADALVELGRRTRRQVDLRQHHGLHPRVGALDVVPLVSLAWPEGTEETAARDDLVATARALARRLAEEADLVTVLYGDADPAARQLPDLRRGGPAKLLSRIEAGEIDANWPVAGRADPQRTGVTCVGVRGVLVAFNVELASGEVGHARRIAAQVRESDGGLPAVRAIGLKLDDHRVQVSMNLLDHRRTSVERAFEAVAARAAEAGLDVLRSELVGCVPGEAWPEGLAERIREPAMSGAAAERRLLESWLPGGALEDDPGLASDHDEEGAGAEDRRLRLLDRPLPAAAEELRGVVAELGERPYRANQVLHAVLRRRCRSFEDMTDLPGDLRRQLDERVRLRLVDLDERAESEDGTVKYLWRLADAGEIESVAIPSERRTTFCVSSQVGCALKCEFCATGALGFQRNLTAGEIVDQVLAMLADGRQDQASLNVVFMGMGEPGYALEPVLQAVRLMNDPTGLGIGARHVTISTAGVVPAIERLAREPLQVRLALSLHSGRQETRARLMNVAERHPVDELLAACRAYHAATRRFITLEVAVMPGINDSPEEIAALTAFAEAVPSKINLIPHNPIPGFGVAEATAETVERVRASLAAGFRGEVLVRRTRGRDVQAACGMLHRARATEAAGD